MERISTIQTASVITQPTDAVERLTLIEKLEQKESEVSQMMQADDAPFPYHYMAGKLNAFREIVNIVKQHQAESGWVSVDERLPTENDGRVSWGVNAYKKYILVNIVSRGIAMTCRFNLTDKCFETADKVTHWMPLPKPPSEVQK